MSGEPTWLPLLGALFAAGLAGSLHCIGMCGPILLSFSQVFAEARNRPAASLRFDFTWYHAGRIWSYALLGFAAGWLGRGLRQAAGFVGMQRGVSLVVGAAVIASGLLLLAVPRLRSFGSDRGCGTERLRGPSWFLTLLRAPGRLPRLLLGATMGLLPCGLVYAALAVAATLPSPAHAAAGMVVFGLGTLPSLSAVLAAGRLIPPRLRLHGTRLAAVAVIAAGCWMTWRTLVDHAHLH